MKHNSLGCYSIHFSNEIVLLDLDEKPKASGNSPVYFNMTDHVPAHTHLINHHCPYIHICKSSTAPPDRRGNTGAAIELACMVQCHKQLPFLRNHMCMISSTEITSNLLFQFQF